MRIKKILVITMALIMLTPALSVLSANIPDEGTFVPNDIDSSVGVIAGDTMFYNIDQLVLPSGLVSENITLPDLADNELFVKVMYVDENYEFNSTHTGTHIWYSIGFMFGQDETFGIDLDVLNTEFVIPKGAATPSIVLPGNPHFNDMPGDGGPSLFFLNDDWADHKTVLEYIGFVVTDSADELTATFTNGTGTLAGTWRKSDGILTHIIFDNIIFMDMDLSGVTFEISLESKENRPLAVSVGDVIEIQAEIMDITLTGSGDFYDNINQTEYSEAQSTLTSLEGETMMKIVVNEVYGMYYVCTVSAYDMDTEQLEEVSEDDIYFNGFMGSIDNIDSLPNFDSDDHDYNEGGFSPVISPDWDIYKGYMELANTLLGVYISEMLTIIDPPADEFVINTFEPTWGFQKKLGYYYFQSSMDINIDINMTDSISTMLGINSVYNTGFQAVIEQKTYLAYHKTGVFAGYRTETTIDLTAYDSTGYTGSGFQPGNVHVEIDIKLVNPDYNPPDAYGGGFIPGFGWLIAIPAIMGVAAVGLISRKRKVN